MQKKLSEILSSFEHESVAADGKTSVPETDIGDIVINSLAFDSRDVTQAPFFRVAGGRI